MDKKNNDSEWYTHSNLSNIQDSTGNSRVSNFVEQVHTLNTLHFIVGICQIFMGLTVIGASILGFINPLWVSVAFTMVASVTTMIGLYFLYITVSKSYDSRSLLRNAMKRVMKAKN
ncbi:hypothetical protein [Fodinibius saliphilus]|uniref:hypothetical protein n=1 Tax=Fodinibius saliphilus TaxID=1920650 RepID=UPI0011090CBE|nr:hypothetical protein [Fodinibius saliphilus]